MLLDLIPEIFNEKLISDIRRENENRRKYHMDEFFFYHMKNKYKLSELIDKACEEVILALFKYSGKKLRNDY